MWKEKGGGGGGGGGGGASGPIGVPCFMLYPKRHNCFQICTTKRTVEKEEEMEGTVGEGERKGTVGGGEREGTVGEEEDKGRNRVKNNCLPNKIAIWQINTKESLLISHCGGPSTPRLLMRC